MSIRPFTHPEHDPELVELDNRLHHVIRASAQRHGWIAVTDETPVEELMARESDGGEIGEEERARQEHFHRILMWIFGRGPHPAHVMQRLYALAYTLAPDLIAYMNQADLGILLKESRGTMGPRLKLLFGGKLRSRSQKRAGASLSYAAAARGNHSRRKGEKRKRRQRDGNEK